MPHGPPLREEAVETALANPAARRILASCIRDPLPVKQISERAGLPLASAYRQVHAMVESGVLVVERSALTKDGKPYDLYRSRIRRGAIEVRTERVNVTWEVNAAIEDRLVHMWDYLRS